MDGQKKRNRFINRPVATSKNYKSGEGKVLKEED